jgi:hypothetical protein
MMDNPNTSLIHTVCIIWTKKEYKLVVYCSIWVRKCNFDRTCIHYPQFVDERYYICLFLFQSLQRLDIPRDQVQIV